MSEFNHFILLNIALQADNAQTARALLRSSKSFSLFVNSNSFAFNQLFAKYGRKDWFYHSRKGNLKAIQWLHCNQIEGCMDYVMDFAASNGHLEVVKWLHSNRTEGCTVEAMNWASYDGHMEVVQWLKANRPEFSSLQR